MHLADFTREGLVKMFHPSISQEDHERNIRRHNLALRKLAEAQQYDPEEFDGLVTSNLADVPNSELKWIWPGRLPVGKLSLIAGETGSGNRLNCCPVSHARSP